MFGSSRDELEARVARLERLLERVLVLIRELQAEGRGQASTAGPARGEEWPGASAPTPGSASLPPVGGVSPPREAVASTQEEVASTQEEVAWARKAAWTREEAAPTRAKAEARGTRLDDLVRRAVLVPGGTLLSRLGIVLLLLSVAYFFKYSIDQGWLTEWVRLAIGVGVGITLAGLGFRGAGKGEPLGTVLAGGGIATFFITGFVGHQWFELVSYPVAFGFLVASSGFGVFLALRSGLQALGIVGLIGALATPLILTSPSPEVVGLALYVSIIVASVAAIYILRGWRSLLLLAVVTSWLVLSPAVGLAAGSTGSDPWAVQGAIAFCALTFWLVPLLRTGLRARDPGRWQRPEVTYVPWHAHLDALSLLMPPVGILMSAWLWDLSRPDLGWAFFGTALLALGVGWWISRTEDPEGSAGTQRVVAILLATVGLGLVLEGDVLYLAFIAEAVALLTIGARRGSFVLMGLGGAIQLIVTGLFLFRLVTGETLLEGDLSSVFDVAAIVGAVLIGLRFRNPSGRPGSMAGAPGRFMAGAYPGFMAGAYPGFMAGAYPGFMAGAYLGLMAFLGRELGQHEPALYLAFILTAAGTQAGAAWRKSPLFSGLGHLPVLVLVSLFLGRLQAEFSLWAGDATSWIDLAAVAAAGFIGTLLSGRQGRKLYLFGAYAGLLAWTARELYPFEQGQAFMSLAFGVEGTVLLVAGLLTDRTVLQQTGMATLLLVVVKVLLVDLAAVEPIWRVLLLFVFALLFLGLSKFVQGRRRHRLDGREAGTEAAPDTLHPGEP